MTQRKWRVAAIVCTGTADTRAADFHSGWLITLAGALGTGLALASLGPLRGVLPRASAPASAAKAEGESTLAESAA